MAGRACGLALPEPRTERHGNREGRCQQTAIEQHRGARHAARVEESQPALRPQCGQDHEAEAELRGPGHDWPARRIGERDGAEDQDTVAPQPLPYPALAAVAIPARRGPDRDQHRPEPRGGGTRRETREPRLAVPEAPRREREKRAAQSPGSDLSQSRRAPCQQRAVQGIEAGESRQREEEVQGRVERPEHDQRVEPRDAAEQEIERSQGQIMPDHETVEPDGQDQGHATRHGCARGEHERQHRQAVDGERKP